MRIDTRTWKAVGALVLLVVVALLTTRFGGGGDATRTDTSSSAPVDRSSSSPGEAVDPQSGLAWIEEGDLPEEALDVLRAIDDGGPFEEPGKDGSTFGNFEGLLPDRARGSYREYTVATPGVQGRGARRIVTGGAGPTAYFWTDDHYDSFSRIRR